VFGGGPADQTQKEKHAKERASARDDAAQPPERNAEHVRSSRGTYAAKPSPKPEARRAETGVNLADFFLPGPRLHLLDF
jgi:hypothetical protein